MDRLLGSISSGGSNQRAGAAGNGGDPRLLPGDVARLAAVLNLSSLNNNQQRQRTPSSSTPSLQTSYSPSSATLESMLTRLLLERRQENNTLRARLAEAEMAQQRGGDNPFPLRGLASATLQNYFARPITSHYAMPRSDATASSAVDINAALIKRILDHSAANNYIHQYPPMPMPIVHQHQHQTSLQTTSPVMKQRNAPNNNNNNLHLPPPPQTAMIDAGYAAEATVTPKMDCMDVLATAAAKVLAQQTTSPGYSSTAASSTHSVCGVENNGTLATSRSTDTESPNSGNKFSTHARNVYPADAPVARLSSFNGDAQPITQKREENWDDIKSTWKTIQERRYSISQTYQLHQDKDNKAAVAAKNKSHECSSVKSIRPQTTSASASSVNAVANKSSEVHSPVLLDNNSKTGQTTVLPQKKSATQGRKVGRTRRYNGQKGAYGDWEDMYISNSNESSTKIINLNRGGRVGVCTKLLSQDQRQSLSTAMHQCKLYRQYTRSQVFHEPRFHVLLSSKAHSDRGYMYHGIKMKAQPIDLVPEVASYAKELARCYNLPQDQWDIGVDLIVYKDGDDGIGWHADDTQDESVVLCVVVDAPGEPRPVHIRPNKRAKKLSDGDEEIQLNIGEGMGYDMDGVMQAGYEHSLPKQKKNKSHRFVLIFRHGREADVPQDSGTAITEMEAAMPDIQDDDDLMSRLSRLRVKPPLVSFGHPKEVLEGSCYSRRFLYSNGAHRADQRGVNGNTTLGSDSIVASRQSAEKHEEDGLQWLRYTSNSRQGGGALCVSYTQRLPVRVFRSSNLKTAYAPLEFEGGRTSYRYDGLHIVTHVLDADGNSLVKDNVEIPLGGTEFTFHLERLPKLDSSVGECGNASNSMSIAELWAKIEESHGRQATVPFVPPRPKHNGKFPKLANDDVNINGVKPIEGTVRYPSFQDIRSSHPSTELTPLHRAMVKVQPAELHGFARKKATEQMAFGRFKRFQNEDRLASPSFRDNNQGSPSRPPVPTQSNTDAYNRSSMALQQMFIHRVSMPMPPPRMTPLFQANSSQHPYQIGPSHSHLTMNGVSPLPPAATWRLRQPVNLVSPPGRAAKHSRIVNDTGKMKVKSHVPGNRPKFPSTANPPGQSVVAKKIPRNTAESCKVDTTECIDQQQQEKNCDFTDPLSITACFRYHKGKGKLRPMLSEIAKHQTHEEKVTYIRSFWRNLTRDQQEQYKKDKKETKEAFEKAEKQKKQKVNKKMREELNQIKAAKKVRVTQSAVREMEIYAHSVVLMQYWQNTIQISDDALHQLEKFATGSIGVIVGNKTSSKDSQTKKKPAKKKLQKRKLSIPAPKIEEAQDVLGEQLQMKNLITPVTTKSQIIQTSQPAKAAVPAQKKPTKKKLPKRKLSIPAPKIEPIEETQDVPGEQLVVENLITPLATKSQVLQTSESTKAVVPAQKKQVKKKLLIGKCAIPAPKIEPIEETQDVPGEQLKVKNPITPVATKSQRLQTSQHTKAVVPAPAPNIEETEDLPGGQLEVENSIPPVATKSQRLQTSQPTKAAVPAQKKPVKKKLLKRKCSIPAPKIEPIEETQDVPGEQLEVKNPISPVATKSQRLQTSQPTKAVLSAQKITPRFVSIEDGSMQSLSFALEASCSVGRRKIKTMKVTVKWGAPAKCRKQSIGTVDNQMLNRKRKEIEIESVSDETMEHSLKQKSPRLSNVVPDGKKKGSNLNQTSESKLKDNMDEKFSVNEKMFAWDKGHLYEAKVVKCKEDNDGFKYLVQYLGFSRNHNRWQDVCNIIKETPSNRKYYEDCRTWPLEDDQIDKQTTHRPSDSNAPAHTVSVENMHKRHRLLAKAQMKTASAKEPKVKMRVEESGNNKSTSSKKRTVLEKESKATVTCVPLRKSSRLVSKVIEPLVPVAEDQTSGCLEKNVDTPRENLSESEMLSELPVLTSLGRNANSNSMQTRTQQKMKTTGLVPRVGTRVSVRIKDGKLYSGEVINVTMKDKTHCILKVRYNDGEIVETSFPHADITLEPCNNLAENGKIHTKERSEVLNNTGSQRCRRTAPHVGGRHRWSARASERLAASNVPKVGMGIKVKFHSDKMYCGKITTVKAHRSKRLAGQASYDIRIHYDDGDIEDATYPDPDICLVPAM